MNAPVREGDVLAGKFRVERVLGVGGMGVVVQAMHLQLEERVALKFMLPEAFADPETAARFSREAKASVKLKSEHIARVSDVGALESGAPYMVMEYLEGEDLSHTLMKRGALPFSEVAEYIIQACEALSEAHSIGIVHRDLKPANLFLAHRQDGSPLIKVLDFGISKASAISDSNLNMTKTTQMMGSPLYMSPEQMKSARDVDSRTDVWSLGVIMYELVTGRVPFEAETLGALFAAVMTEPHPPVQSFRPDVPPPLAILINQCLAKKVEERCANVAEIAIALAPFCPPRTLATIDRIATVSQVKNIPRDPGSSQNIRPVAQSYAELAASQGAAPPQAHEGWGNTVHQNKGNKKAIAAAAVLLIAGIGGAGFIAMNKKANPQSTATAATETTPASEPPKPEEKHSDPAPEPVAPSKETVVADLPPTAVSAAPQAAPSHAPAKPAATTITAPAKPKAPAKPTSKSNALDF